MLQASPDGFTVVRTLDFRTRTTTPIAAGQPDKFDILWCDWATNERLLCAVMSTVEFARSYFPLTRLFAVDANGGNLVNLLWQTDVSLATRLDRVVDWLADEPDNVLVEAVLPKFQVVDIGTGYAVSNHEMLRRSARDRALTEDMYTDGTGTVRLFVEFTGVNTLRWYERESNDADWSVFRETQVGNLESRFFPLGFGARGDRLLAVEEGDAQDTLVAIELTPGYPQTRVFTHRQIEVPVRRYMGKYNRLVGVGYTEEVTRLRYIDDAVLAIQSRMQRQYPNQHIAVIDEDWQQRYYLVLISGPANAGVFYRLDTSDNALVEIGPAFRRLQSVDLAPVRTLEFRARDGAVIPAYLTLPPSAPPTNLPTVVLTRGEPLSRSGLALERDPWDFNPLAQFLAANGYAVLQIGIRGLGGYVVQWDEVGTFRGWRQAIDDIADGVAHVVDEGIADGDALCIVGWGAGGFAAAMSAIEHPQTYRCIASIAGVTDPDDYRNHLDRVSIESVEPFIGRGRDVTDGWAPVKRANEIQAPVLLFHAQNDFVVPYQQSRGMQRALRRADKTVELIEYARAEHSIYPEPERIDMLARLAEFVGRHLREADAAP